MRKNRSNRSGRTYENRVVIEGVRPEIDGGLYAAKGIIGERFQVEADIFADGHDLISGFLLYRKRGAKDWSRAPLEALGNDRWRAYFPLDEIGFYEYGLEAWIDPFKTWTRDYKKKVEAGTNEPVDALIGAGLVEGAVPEPSRITRYPKTLSVEVDRERAGFSSWYELFPRSHSPQPGRHGTFKDCESKLPEIAAMGFDVLYFPPIHPIGEAKRKGKNNHPEAKPGEPGSPWAIGSKAGGHKAIHPELGTLEDFRGLLARAKEHGLEIALDLAFQCAPDHPYLKDHPEWFKKRPDGTIQYAENPPKKYQDIYPFDFETRDWEALWGELKSVVDYWIDQGVRIFRVDNPHTKALPFWKWLLREVKSSRPDAIFLSEAFTRPKIMYHLAKIGFSQSYTYFTWRNTKQELTEYLSELTRGEPADFFRPNFWPNTPDILSEYLQHGGEPAFMIRLVLAATLSSNYGIYGPAFEVAEAVPLKPGSEEYLNSEKYEIRHWEGAPKTALRKLIAKVNRIRREQAALQGNRGLEFHPTDNPQLIAYTKRREGDAESVLTVVNLDFRYRQAGWVDLRLEALGLLGDAPYRVEDLLTGKSYDWRGGRNYVELNPHVMPAHIFKINGGAKR